MHFFAKPKRKQIGQFWEIILFCLIRWNMKCNWRWLVLLICMEIFILILQTKAHMKIGNRLMHNSNFTILPYLHDFLWKPQTPISKETFIRVKKIWFGEQSKAQKLGMVIIFTQTIFIIIQCKNQKSSKKPISKFKMKFIRFFSWTRNIPFFFEAVNNSRKPTESFFAALSDFRNFLMNFVQIELRVVWLKHTLNMMSLCSQRIYSMYINITDWALRWLNRR